MAIPKKKANYNDDFKFDLIVGQVKERELAEIFELAKIEVKYDKLANQTGNLFVEFECRGEPSGISTTEADWWCFVIGTSEKNCTYHLIKTKYLKELCREAYTDNKLAKGGDDMLSKGVLLKVSKIFKS